MAKTSKFEPVKVTKGKGIAWRLSVPEKYSGTGKRQQLFFETQKKASEHAATLKAKREDHGTQAKAIPPTLAEMATSAAARLAPYGVSITDLVNRFIAEETRRASSVPIETAVAKFRVAKDGRSDSQTAAYKMMGDRMIEDFPGRILATITGEEIADHIQRRTNGASGFNLRRRLITAFIRWCAKPPREWCKADIVAHVERKDTVAGECGILTAKDAGRLMLTAETHFPDCVPAFAIALFTGMRQDEIERLEPSDITTEGITVPAKSSKTRRRRFIHMPEPLADWLKAYPIGDTVCPPNWVRKEKAVRRLARWAVWSDLVPKLGLAPDDGAAPVDTYEAAPPAGLPEWPGNALRHTAASVAVTMGKPLESLIFEHGHSGGVEMLRRHYLGIMPKAEAIAIWALEPQLRKVKSAKGEKKAPKKKANLRVA
jgi:integrase